MYLTRTIRVMAQPYSALDSQGRPCGAYPYEPQFTNGAAADTHVRFIGAERVWKETQPARPPAFRGHPGTPAEGDVEFLFSTEPVLLPFSDYYARAVKSGELVAYDVESWVDCGCKREAFVDPKAAIAKAFAATHANFVAHYATPPHAAVKHFAQNFGGSATPGADDAAHGDASSNPPTTTTLPAPHDDAAKESA